MKITIIEGSGVLKLWNLWPEFICHAVNGISLIFPSWTGYRTGSDAVCPLDIFLPVMLSQQFTLYMRTWHIPGGYNLLAFFKLGGLFYISILQPDFFIFFLSLCNPFKFQVFDYYFISSAIVLIPLQTAQMTRSCFPC